MHGREVAAERTGIAQQLHRSAPVGRSRLVVLPGLLGDMRVQRPSALARHSGSDSDCLGWHGAH